MKEALPHIRKIASQLLYLNLSWSEVLNAPVCPSPFASLWFLQMIFWFCVTCFICHRLKALIAAASPRFFCRQMKLIAHETISGVVGVLSERIPRMSFVLIRLSASVSTFRWSCFFLFGEEVESTNTNPWTWNRKVPSAPASCGHFLESHLFLLVPQCTSVHHFRSRPQCHPKLRCHRRHRKNCLRVLNAAMKPSTSQNQLETKKSRSEKIFVDSKS